ncbi:hypothetical protein MES4922_40013 [Mesorhizobium ventifaucium]|uniref:Uncharacterized protein n=1 Tax=Mesorhizobium ventifaucium TaxID=666020 RepID=A0ABM9E790_9HYPH|nr:hypothetical protein MES4922_40013 [Mesorhizobium ventifaucium]
MMICSARTVERALSQAGRLLSPQESIQGVTGQLAVGPVPEVPARVPRTHYLHVIYNLADFEEMGHS